MRSDWRLDKRCLWTVPPPDR